MYRKFINWCREHKMYSTLDVVVRVERALRFRMSEKMLNHWFESVGKTLPSVKCEMRILQRKPDWSKLSVEDKRHIYCAEMYY